MKKINLSITLIALMITTISFANTFAIKGNNQTKKEDVAVYLKNTNFPIREDQKYFMVKKEQPNQAYNNAVKLNHYAQTLLNEGKYDQALICSSKARQIAVKILTGFTNDKVAAHYKTYPDEKKSFTVLQNDHSTTESWLNKIK